MGGKDTHEFMVLSEVGEDTIAYSDTSNYAANIEMAPVVTHYEKSNEALKDMEKVLTENQKTIADVSSFLSYGSNNASNRYYLKWMNNMFLCLFVVTMK